MKKTINYWEKQEIVSHVGIMLVTIEFLILMLLSFLIGNLFYHTDIKFFTRFLLHNLDSNEVLSYLISVWQVQVMIAILVVTIFALVLPRLDIRLYGIKLYKVLMLSRKYEANYYDYIIIGLMLAASNILFIAKKDINGAVILFVFTILIIIHITIISIDIITNNSKGKNMARRYFIQEVSKTSSVVKDELLDELVQHTLLLVEKRQYDEAEENIKLLLSLLNSLSTKLEVSNLVERKFIFLISSLTQIDDYKFVSKIIDFIQDSKIKTGDLNFYISEVANGLTDKLSSCRRLADIEEIEKVLYQKFILSQDSNQSDDEKVEIAINCFASLLNNRVINVEEKTRLVERGIKRYTSLQLMKFDSKDFYVYFRIIQKLGKVLIDSTEANYLKILLNNLMLNNAIGNLQLRNEISKTINTLYIYIYYRGLNESLINKNERCSIAELNDIHLDIFGKEEKFSDCVLKKNNLWSNYHSIYSFLTTSGWEYLPKNYVKRYHIGYDTNKFYVFYTVACNKINEFSYELNSFSTNDLVIFLSYFNEYGNIKSDFTKDFEDFCKWNKIDYNVSLLEQSFYKVIINEYVRRELIIDNNNIYFEKNQIMECIQQKIDEKYPMMNHRDFIFKFNVHKKIYLSSKELIDNPLTINNILKSNCVNIDEIILEIIEDHLVKYEYQYNDPNIAEDVEEKLKLHQSDSIGINYIIGNKISQECYIQKSSNEESILRIENSMNEYSLQSPPYQFYYINNEKVLFNIKIVDILIQDLSAEEIDARCKPIDDEKIEVKVSLNNNISTILEKTEAEEYLMVTQKKLVIIYQVNTSIKDICGISFRILFNKALFLKK